MAMHTRKDYMDGRVTHQEYYAQFVTDSTIRSIREWIGENVIKNSNDEYFNDIQLHKWDNAPVVINAHRLRDCGDTFSMCAKVCICKAAATIIKSE